MPEIPFRMPEMPFRSPRIEVTRRWCAGHVLVLCVCGELDLCTTPRLAGALDAASGNGAAGVVVDLTDVSFLGSAAMITLLARQRVLGDSVPLVVVAGARATRRPLALVEFDRTVPVCASVEQALTRIGGRGRE